MFNPVFFNKSALHKLLIRGPLLRPYLPDGKPAVTVSDVTGLLKKHGCIYLKPVNGYQGRGIIEVRRISRNQVRVKSDKFSGNRSLLQIYTAKQFESFANVLLKKNKYLVQRGLESLKMGDRKIDFRVVVHRGERGTWHSAGIRPKLGKAGSMVTNSHAGGTKTTWEKLERWARRTGKARFRPRASSRNRRSRRTRYLTKYRPTLSHLGIDVAVDRNGRIYLLDFNEVPGRDLLTPGMLRRATELTAGFARYLADRF
ncbi:YheC/YheD family protein [Paenibacillus sp. P25]|nr:YheC/YheD family protein [Paenibacillus sp. P25]